VFAKEFIAVDHVVGRIATVLVSIHMIYAFLKPEKF
jgi:hypothetical protein